MPDKEIKQAPNLKIELPNDETIVQYSNFSIVSHSPEEIVIDFARILPGREGAKVISRIVMTPKNAKMFLGALTGNIRNYEEKFGEIALPNNPQPGNMPIQ